MDFEKRIAELFIELPDPPRMINKGVVQSVLSGKLLYVGGALPYIEGKLSFKGRLGLEVSTDQGGMAARHALSQALSAVRDNVGSLNKIKQIVQLHGFIATGGDFKEHDKVLDPASSLLFDIFGVAGKHARMVVGVNSLPQNACLSLTLLVEIK
ncbi:MAG: RidA family protein [Deltaproteobacteria bacterium]|nr:RidA family protein [Deltaproteobacteria bacterium]